MLPSDPHYREFVGSLHHLTNRDELLISPYRIVHGIQLLLPQIERDGYSYHIDPYGFVLTIHLPNGRNRIIYNADYGIDSSALRRIFEDKIYTSKLLRNAHFPVADDMLVLRPQHSYSNDDTTSQACFAFAERCGYPLIFKPNNGSLGAGVIKIFDTRQLSQVLADYYSHQRGLYVLQAYIPGQDYRVIYLDGQIIVVYERIPPSIVGNGQDPIITLLQHYGLTDYHDRILRYLTDQGIAPDTVLLAQQQLTVLPTANVATGGLVRQIQPTERDREFLNRVAQCFGARYFGIDIITTGELANGTILEINKSPITEGISAVSPGFREQFARLIWQTIKRDEGC